MQKHQHIAVNQASVDDTPATETLMSELQLLQSSGSKKIALVGSRHISLTHQQLIEMLAYALGLSGNHLITSGASGTNAAVIRGVQRAHPANLTVILPQTIDQQPPETQEQLATLPVVKVHPERRAMSLAQASQLCNQEIVDMCQQLICFLYHSSTTLKETLVYAQEQRKIVTMFYMD